MGSGRECRCVEDKSGALGTSAFNDRREREKPVREAQRSNQQMEGGLRTWLAEN